MFKRPIVLGLLLIMWTTKPANTGTSNFDPVTEIDLASEFVCSTSNSEKKLSKIKYLSTSYETERKIQLIYFENKSEPNSTTCEFDESSYTCNWEDGKEIKLNLSTPTVKRTSQTEVQYMLSGAYKEHKESTPVPVLCNMKKVSYKVAD